jgi:catechol 2,3-dioxygenase-like lactoylglutathione lyase family enzyme
MPSGVLMRLTGVMHTGFTVSDMERSIRFYRDTLGMQLVRRQEGTAPYLANVTGFPGVRLQIAFLKVSTDDPHVLELLQYVSHPAQGTDRATNRPGNGHLCIKVDDIHEWYRTLIAQGVAAISEPVLITAGINEGAYAVYVRDPDGFTIELYEPAPSAAAT